MFGFLVIDKPPGITSRAALNSVSKVVKPVKTGHAGTLDPLATGVLVACLGPATRLATYVQQMPKFYTGTFRFGLESDTEDIDGNVLQIENPPLVSKQQLQETLPRFLGPIQQLPPQFSALKIAGKRAYQLARQGKTADLKPRNISIYDLQLTHFNYPDFEIQIECGSGTYVRSLGRDIAQSLNTSAVMTSLNRNAIGPFQIEQAIDLNQISLEEINKKLLVPNLAVSYLPAISVAQDQIVALSHGALIESGDRCFEADEAAAFDSQGKLIAILRRTDQKRFAPAVNFSQYWLGL